MVRRRGNAFVGATAFSAAILAAAAARAADQVFVDNFANGVVENSDAVPNFWTQVNLGTNSTATDTGAGLKLVAAGTGFPQGQISSSSVQSNFNFFHAPIVLAASGLGFAANSAAESQVQFTLTSQPLSLSGAPAEYQAEDAFTLILNHDNSIVMGLKLDAQNASTGWDRYQLIGPIGPSVYGTKYGTTQFSGAIRSFQLTLGPTFYDLKVTHDTSASDTTPVTEDLFDGLDLARLGSGNGNWSTAANPNGDTAINIQDQLNNSQSAGDLSTFSVGQVSVSTLDQHWQKPGTTNGNWNDLTSWSDNRVPDYPGANAVFGQANGATVVTNNTNVTAGVIDFNSTNSYTINANNADQNSPGVIELATRWLYSEIKVEAGNHTIAAPINLFNDVVTTVAAGSTLTLSGQMTPQNGNITFTKAGGGTAEILNAQLIANVVVNQGTLRVLPSPTANAITGASDINTLSVASGASMDLTNNCMVIDYNGDSPIGTVRQMLKDGRLKSTTNLPGTRLAYAEASDLGVNSFEQIPVDGTSILIKYTYGGDTNFDGKVDVTDLGTFASHWQQTGLWTSGDFNYDGNIDVTDLGILASSWQAGVNNPLAAGSFQQALEAVGLGNVLVPEPAELTLAAIGLASMALRRRRK